MLAEESCLLGANPTPGEEARALLNFHGILEGAEWLVAYLLGFAWFSSHFSLGSGLFLLVFGFLHHTSSWPHSLAMELELPDCHPDMCMP